MAPPDTGPPQLRVLHLPDQRAIGRFLGNGIRPVMGSSSLTAEAQVLGARLRSPRRLFGRLPLLARLHLETDQCLSMLAR